MVRSGGQSTVLPRNVGHPGAAGGTVQNAEGLWDQGFLLR